MAGKDNMHLWSKVAEINGLMVSNPLNGLFDEELNLSSL